jgi:hypothetical protein
MSAAAVAVQPPAHVPAHAPAYAAVPAARATVALAPARAPGLAPARAPVTLAPVARVASPAIATHPQEDELGRHLKQCKAQQTMAFRMAGWLERIHGVLAPRFVTTATTASAVMLVLLMWN